MTTSDDIRDRLRHLANRGNRSSAALEELGLDDLRADLEEALNHLDDIEGAVDDYLDNDPAEFSGTDEKESARETRTEAWETIQEHAGELADVLDRLRQEGEDR